MGQNLDPDLDFPKFWKCSDIEFFVWDIFTLSTKSIISLLLEIFSLACSCLNFCRVLSLFSAALKQSEY